MSRAIGRYVLHDEIAAGGMASVHLAKLAGAAGFSRAVAVKRLHAHFAKDPDFVAMFIDEARLASRIRHPNVVPVLDVLSTDGELFLVMEYVHGEPLSKLARIARKAETPIPAAIAVAIMVNVLEALEAAHQTRGPEGELLRLVHRDVSPQNVLVGDDGAARLLDFGIAKAIGRLQTTREGEVKGKSSYMSPEQVRGLEVDRRSDVFAAAVVLWELLTNKRLFVTDHPMSTMALVLEMPIPPPGLSPALDEVVLRGLARNVDDRFPTARAMADALARALPPASSDAVSAWVAELGGEALKERAALVAQVESSAVTAYPDAVIDDDTQKEEEPPTMTGFATLPRSPRLPIAIGIALGVLMLGGFGAWRLAQPRAPAPIASIDVVEPPPPPALTSATVPPTAVSVPEPAESTSKPRPVARPRPKPHPEACNPPWTIDAQGVRILKRECL